MGKYAKGFNSTDFIARVMMTKSVIALKKFCNSKKFLGNAARDLRGNLMGDNIGALENQYRAAKAVKEILTDKLNVRTADVLAEKKNLRSGEDDKVLKMKAEVMAIIKEYGDRYGREPNGLKDIIPITLLRKEVQSTKVIPAKDVLANFQEGISRLLEYTSEDVFNIPLRLMDYHLIIDNEQIRNQLVKCLADTYDGNFKEAIKRCALAFSISLEKQRQKLNYLMERQELSTAMFFLDSPETLYYKFQDYNFILMALQVDLNKYKMFEKIIPTVMINDEDRESGVSITISDYLDERWIDMKWALYCFNFVTETVLMWESMNLKKSLTN